MHTAKIVDFSKRENKLADGDLNLASALTLLQDMVKGDVAGSRRSFSINFD